MLTQVLAVLVLSLGCAGWQSTSPVCLAGATFDRGECVAQQGQMHHIPFRDGQEVRVTQGYHGYETHREDVSFAIDFACDPGTPIVASRSGVVWSVREDSTKSCPDEECVDDANYVILDHGDGTYSTYYHLQFMGSVVEPGDRVCRGQLLGMCGATGYATGAHLHFSVVDTRWKTIPVGFAEAHEQTDGILLPRHSYVSENERMPYCEANNYSRLPKDAFIHRGVKLESEIPTVVEGQEDRTMRIAGKYLGEGSHIAIHRRETNGENGRWYEQCGEIDDEGRFAFEIDWPESVFTDGYYFLMVTGSDEYCSAPGWAWAYRIRVRDAEDEEFDN